jgi:uncharacterized membrane protein YfcA
MAVYIWISLIVFLSAFVGGLTGFGVVLLAIPLLALFFDIKIVIPLVMLIGTSVNVILLIQLHPHLELKRIYPLILGSIAGILIGVYFLKRVDKALIHWLLGLLLISYSVYNLMSLKSLAKGIREGWAYLFGFFAGCLGGALGAMGPPIIAYVSLTDWDKDKIKVTLQAYFVLSGSIVIFIHALSGLITSTIMQIYAVSIPSLILGTLIGSFFYNSVKETSYRRIILVLLALLGALMIYRA